MGLFSKKTTYDPMSAYTPEQRKSIEALMSLASTGSGGGLTLGQSYNGALGNYEQGAQGMAGGQQLEDLMTGAYDPNSDMGKARGIYQGFSDLGQFNPDDPRWGYAAFNKALEKAGAESASALEREAAIGGRRFGTAILGEKADLAENMNLQRQQRLSEMFMGAQQFSALGAQGFTGLANQVAQIAGLNINYDDYQRQLKDTKARDALNEFKRTREEELSRLGLMQEQWQNPMGTITKKGPSTLAKMLGEVSPLMGSYNTHKYGYTQGQASISQAVDAAMKILTGGMGSTGYQKPSGNFNPSGIQSSYSPSIPSYQNSGFSMSSGYSSL
jgi:hypothetical protein